MEITCLRCREKIARSRGLCASCRILLGNAVKAGLTTWKKLEAASLAMPDGRRKAMEADYDWHQGELARQASASGLSLT